MKLWLLPQGEESTVLIGALLPPSYSPGLAVLLTSASTQKEFPAEDRELLEPFTRFKSWAEAVAAATPLGGDESDLEEWVRTGLLKRFPASFSPEEFVALFSDLSLVTMTGGAVSSTSEDYVDLAVPDHPDRTVPVSPLLYRVIKRSAGPLPQTISDVCMGDQEAITLLIGEITAMLPVLVNARVACLMYAQ